MLGMISSNGLMQYDETKKNGGYDIAYKTRRRITPELGHLQYPCAGIKSVKEIPGDRILGPWGEAPVTWACEYSCQRSAVTSFRHLKSPSLVIKT